MKCSKAKTISSFCDPTVLKMCLSVQFSSVAQLCPTLCDLMDCSLSRSSVYGIFQARVLEWIAISFSRGSSWPMDPVCIPCISCIDRRILYHWATRSAKQHDISSIQSLSHLQLFMTPWTATHQASLSIINSWSLLKLMSIELVMPSNHLILCHPLLLLPSVFPSIRVFSNESALGIMVPQY